MKTVNKHLKYTSKATFGPKGTSALMFLKSFVSRQKKLVLASGLMLACGVSQASPWYVEAGWGEANSKVSQGKMNSQLPLGSQITSFDNKDDVWSVKLGYQWTPYIAFDIGYVDQGSAHADLVALTPDPYAFHEQVKRISPVLADGWTAGAKFTLWQGERFFVELPVGLFVWESKISSWRGASALTSKVDGSDWYAGLNLGVNLNEHWSLHAGYQSYDIEPKRVESWLISARFKF